MKTTIKLFFAALVILATYSSKAQCGGPYNYYIVENGGQVLFYDSLNLNLPVNWNFGDGDTSNTSSYQVSHTYTQSGTYSVCITVNDTPACGSIYTYCDTISVNVCAGISNFGISQTGFGDYSFGANINIAGNTYSWSFGDGNTAASSNPSHQYAGSGSFPVSLIVTDATAGCADTSTQNLNFSLCAFANNFSFDSFGTNPSSFAVYNPVPGYTYTWHFGDGGTGSGDSVTHQYSHFGSYTACLVTSDAVTGCADSNCNTSLVDPCGIYASGITANVNGLIASFNADFDWQGQGQSGLTYAWSLPGATPSTSTSATPTVNYGSTGSYTVTLIVSNASQCSDTVSQSVNIITDISYYSISGAVSETSSGACGTVYLISQDTTGHLVLLDSLVNNDSLNFTCGGYYVFYNLPVDTYYIKAALDSGDPEYANYLPTYFGNELHWANATPVIISNSNATANINLIAGSNPGGPGFVSGWINQGAGLVLQQQGNNITRGAGTTLAGVQVNLLTSDNTPVAYTFSDANGQFRFTNLAYNTYQIYVERLNIGEVPTTFTLSAQNPGDTTLSFTVDSNTATSINDLSGINVSAIFPNPVSTLVDIEISSKLPADATLTLNDMLGQSVATQKLHLVSGLNKGELNMTNLASGIYELVVQANSQQLTYKVVKAK